MATAKRVDFDLDRNDAVDSMGSVDESGSVSERAFSTVIVNPLDVEKALDNISNLHMSNGWGEKHQLFIKWRYLEAKETQHLRSILEKEVQKLELPFLLPYCHYMTMHSLLWKGPWAHYEQPSPRSDHKQAGTGHIKNYVEIPNDGTDVWEINLKQLKFGNQVASGAYGDLYKDTYCSQEVANMYLFAERVYPGGLHYEISAGDRQRPRKKQKPNRKVRGREWILKKKERMRRKGNVVLADTKYTGCKRKACF